MEQRHIEVCFSPLLLATLSTEQKIVVVVDIFRATTSICAAFENGVSYIIPTAGLEQARELKAKGYLVAAERNGIKSDFADFGNSPQNFQTEEVRGKPVVYSTTNGTRAVQMASGAAWVVAGAFSNHSALCQWILSKPQDVLVLCAGWKDRFSLEDSVYAGALAEKLLHSRAFTSDSDAVNAAVEIWKSFDNNLIGNKHRFAHYHRLKHLFPEEVTDFCLTIDTTSVVPAYSEGVIKPL